MADEESGPRSQMWKHEDIVEWLREEKALSPKADQVTTVAYAFAYRNEYRKTQRYADLVEGHAAEAEAEAEKAREEREAAKAAKAAEAAAAKAAAKSDEKPAKATKATKAAPEPAKATKGKGKGKATDDNPFS